jgi:hypothetical protein
VGGQDEVYAAPRVGAAHKDLWLVVALAVVTLILAMRVDAFEALADFLRKHESWQLDELVFLCMVLSVSLSVFAFRRTRDLSRVLQHERALQARLQQMTQAAGGPADARPTAGALAWELRRDLALPASILQTIEHDVHLSPVMGEAVSQATRALDQAKHHLAELERLAAEDARRKSPRRG